MIASGDFGIEVGFDFDIGFTTKIAFAGLVVFGLGGDGKFGAFFVIVRLDVFRDMSANGLSICFGLEGSSQDFFHLWVVRDAAIFEGVEGPVANFGVGIFHETVEGLLDFGNGFAHVAGTEVGSGFEAI